MTETQIEILDFRNEFKEDFRDLNMEWLERYFEVENYDKLVLGNPQKYIIDDGGFVFFAMSKYKPAGTVALINRGTNGFELSKMLSLLHIKERELGR